MLLSQLYGLLILWTCQLDVLCMIDGVCQKKYLNKI